MFTMKKAVVAGMIVASLAVGISAVGAQDAGGRGGRGGFGPVGRPDGEIVQLVADATGLDLADLTQQLRDGATLADLIAANGGDVEAVKAQVVEEATAKLAQAVTDGKLTQEQADQALLALNDHIDAFFSGDGILGHGRVAQAVIKASDIVADQLGMTPLELGQALRSGQTLEDLLAERDISWDTFSANVVAAATEQANQAVADGKLTQEQADALISGLQDRLANGLSDLAVGGERGPRGGKGI